MGNFDEIIAHLKRKKHKKGETKDGEYGYFGPPIYEEEKDSLYIWYNYYYVFIHYDDEKVFTPYSLDIEKPCIIRQQVATAFSHSSWASQEDVWMELQQKWKRTII